MMNKGQIKKTIPYDDPFLFVDGVEEISENKIKGYYLASATKEYFKGHFVDLKIMPGVLIIEGLAQLSSILLRKIVGTNNKDYHFLAYNVKSADFLKPIFPGNKIILKAEILNIFDGKKNMVADIRAEALVGSEIKCKALFSIATISKEKFAQTYNK